MTEDHREYGGSQVFTEVLSSRSKQAGKNKNTELHVSGGVLGKDPRNKPNERIWG